MSPENDENNRCREGGDAEDDWEPPELDGEDYYLEPMEVATRPASFEPPAEVAEVPWETRCCSRCKNDFRTRNDSVTCYGCTLNELTHGLPPEEGDFNTAKIQSGTMTDEEWRLLQRDLWQVETGSSLPEPEEFEDDGCLGWEDDWVEGSEELGEE